MLSSSCRQSAHSEQRRLGQPSGPSWLQRPSLRCSTPTGWMVEQSGCDAWDLDEQNLALDHDYLVHETNGGVESEGLDCRRI